jgi:hypothetical protein
MPRTPHELLSTSSLEDGDAARGRDIPDFLDSHRALAVCAKEFDQLVDEIVRLAGEVDTGAAEIATEVRRSPNRCIVQLGPVALTISWLRSGAETISDGRLLVIEWVGTVGRGPTRLPERTVERRPAVAERAPATIAREVVLLAEATNADNWRWRREDGGRASYSSTELATRCVDSLVKGLLAHAS